MPPKDLSDFLKETSIYLVTEHCSVTYDPLVLIHIALAEISSNILDLNKNKPVRILVDESSVVLTLGKLGSFHSENTPEDLSQIAKRLYLLSNSPRFVRAILGYYPA